MIPTNPIKPLTDTAAAVASVAAITTVSLTRLALIPRVEASSSPTASTSRWRPCEINMAPATTANGSKTRTSDHPTVVSLPKIHE